MFAVQIDGHEVSTVEGLARSETAGGGMELGPAEEPRWEHLHLLQRAFHESHALQCGFCTPGILMTMAAFLEETPHPTRAEIREALSGHLCRCTGYQNIVEGGVRAAELCAEDSAS